MRYSKMRIKIGGGKCSYWKQEHLTFCTQNLQNFRYFFILNQDLCFCPNTVGVFYQYYIAQTQAIENPCGGLLVITVVLLSSWHLTSDAPVGL